MYPRNTEHKAGTRCVKVLILSLSRVLEYRVRIMRSVPYYWSWAYPREFWAQGRYTHVRSRVYPINTGSKFGLHPVFLIPVHHQTSLICKLYYNSHALNLPTIFMPHLQNMGYALEAHKYTFCLRAVQWCWRMCCCFSFLGFKLVLRLLPVCSCHILLLTTGGYFRHWQVEIAPDVL